MSAPTPFARGPETARVAALRERVRAAMERPPAPWSCPAAIDPQHLSEPLPVRKARAEALKLASMPEALWEGQLFAGSMTLEEPRIHAEWGFPDYLTEADRARAEAEGLSTSCFGHIVPDYPTLLRVGLSGLRARAEAELARAATPEETAFLRSVIISLDGVMAFAGRLAARCDAEAETAPDVARASELRQMAANLRQAPAGAAQTFWQALQAVWLLHMTFHSTRNGNAMGRLDQYAWPYLEADLAADRIGAEFAAELVDCFCLKFSERAQALDEQRPEAREEEPLDLSRRTRHSTSSQLGTDRDSLDATNHWLQNIIVGGITPASQDGTNPLTYLLLESYRRHQMTNPVMSLRLHRDSPKALLAFACEVLREGGGMPALFNDEAIVPSLERIGIPTPEARDYTNDGCWEIILPGRTDFRFQRLSLMLCLEWALNQGRSRLDGSQQGPETGDPRTFTTYDQVWEAFCTQLEAMVGRVVRRVAETVDDRAILAPVPLLSALIEGCLASRRDMTAGGARFRTFSLLAEAAAHAIDSLSALKTVVFEQRRADMAEVCDALVADFVGHGGLRQQLLAAPKYGNDDARADDVGRAVIEAFATTVARHAEAQREIIKFPCGAGTFSWYIGIGEGLGASPDGRLCGEPVSSNFSPALGRDLEGIPSAILSYARMHRHNLPAGSPLDLRLARRLVEGEEGIARMIGLLRGFVATGGTIMTLTVADTEELRAAQREPENYRSLRVRMGGWCAYFTMLSREQQEHHIRRQEGRR